MRNLAMKDLGILLLVVCATAIMGGCQPIPLMQQAKPASVEQLVTRQQPVAPFKAIVVDGSMDIDLEPHTPMNHSQRLEFVTSKEGAGTVVATVENGTLYLRNMEKFHLKQNPRVRVRVPVAAELVALTYNSPGVLTGERVRGRNMVINVSGGTVNLSGSEIALRSLNVSHSGNIRITNVKNTQILKIQGIGHARLTLVGTVNEIEVVLSGDSILDAKLLRASNGWVNTTDNAQANVNVRHSLNAFSTGYSNIYYHQQRPELLSKYLRQRGSVLFFPSKIEK